MKWNATTSSKIWTRVLNSIFYRVSQKDVYTLQITAYVNTLKKRIFIFSKMGHPHRDVTSFLNERLPNRWIGRRGFVEYAPRSPDLTPLDFFLWGHLKDKVYALKPTIIAELRAIIECECMQIPRELLHDVCYSIASRYRRCLDQNGHQFEKRQWQNDRRMLLNSFTCWKWNK